MGMCLIKFRIIFRPDGAACRSIGRRRSMLLPAGGRGAAPAYRVIEIESAKWRSKLSMSQVDQQRAPQLGLGAGDSSIHFGVLSPEQAAAAFATAQREFLFEKMVGQGGKPLPRVQCLQADPTADGAIPVYRYPGVRD